MENTVMVRVNGQYQYPNMTEPKRFEEIVKFILYPPKADEPHYGTGCYMGVEFENGYRDSVDVRYTRTRNLKELAAVFIRNYWGDNLIEYTFI